MKKNFIYLTYLASLMLAPACLTSCFEADEEPYYGVRVDDLSFLAGQWNECDANGNLRNDATEEEVYHLIYRADGTAEQYAVTRGVTVWSRKYTFWVEGSTTEGGIYMRYDVDEANHSAEFILKDDILKYGRIYYKKQK